MEEVLRELQKAFSGDLPEKWQVGLEEYPRIAGEILADWTGEASKGRRLVRVTGQSGSGKTMQLVPAVEAWFGGSRPVLVAASKIVDYHPHVKEIVEEYGEDLLRQKTDDFSAMMMFLVLKELLAKGYDVILDLALVEPRLEAILVKWLKNYGYESWMTMTAVSPRITQEWLDERGWRHLEKVEQKFLGATRAALEYYAEVWPQMRMVMWSAWDVEPVYDGPMEGAVKVWQKCVQEERDTEVDVAELARGKIEYLER